MSRIVETVLLYESAKTFSSATSPYTCGTADIPLTYAGSHVDMIGVEFIQTAPTGGAVSSIAMNGYMQQRGASERGSGSLHLGFLNENSADTTDKDCTGGDRILVPWVQDYQGSGGVYFPIEYFDMVLTHDRTGGTFTINVYLYTR